MSIPDAFRDLYAWIESERLYVDRPDGARIGFLFPEAEQRASWTETERLGGTDIKWMAAGSDGLERWFGHSDPEVLQRLCVFAQTGADGSMAAFWLDDSGAQKIVHLGSGSGSTLVCVLSASAVDFIRLIAIGYDEICWNSEFAAPPKQSGLKVHPNTRFQAWVVSQFQTSIPESASEIVLHPNEMEDDHPEDEFARWVCLHRK